MSDSDDESVDLPDNVVRVDFGAKARVSDVIRSKGGSRPPSADTQELKPSAILRAKNSIDSAPEITPDVGKKNSENKTHEVLRSDLKRVLDPVLEDKLDSFRDYIDDAMVMVWLDPRRTGVVLPVQFHGNIELKLNFSHRFHIPDFSYDKNGVKASLSFNGTSHLCSIPWTAVFAIYSHSREIWRTYPSDIPPELEGLAERLAASEPLD